MRLLAGFLVCAMVVCAAEKKAISPAGVKPVGPYTPGVMVGDFLYVSGQGAPGPDGKIPDTPEAQVRQALNNVKAVVEAAGLTMEHVVYTHLYLTDMNNLEQADKVWAEFFPKAPPARAVVGVFKMPGGTPVEVNAVAFRDLARKRVFSPADFPAQPGVSPGVMAGERYYVSSALGMDMATGKVPENADEQVNLAFANMKQILGAAGLDFPNLVFVNPYMAAGVSRAMNKIYASHFEMGNTPARATFRVTSLPHNTTIAYTGVAIADLSKRHTVRPKNMRPSATASPCMLADDTLYCSAKDAFVPGIRGGIFYGTVESQVRMSLRGLLDSLEELGMNFSNVVATNVYLDNIDDFAKMNGVYAQYFSGIAPTRTTIEHVAPLPNRPTEGDSFPALDEISCIAVK
jgi:reactive intermediate/imine deaminase